MYFIIAPKKLLVTKYKKKNQYLYKDIWDMLID